MRPAGPVETNTARVLAALEAAGRPLGTHDLVKATGLDVQAVSTARRTLEAKGYVKNTSGKAWGCNTWELC